MFSKEQALDEIKSLFPKYERLRTHSNYNEEQTKKDLILPLFRALNWDIENSDEVTAEESIARKRVDYGFRTMLSKRLTILG
jgi:predicted type IV restriction endonuclease